MKKIKLKSLVDSNSKDIDDIYSSICQELNLTKSSSKVNSSQSDKQVQLLLKSTKQPIKKVKEDDLLLSMTKRLNLVESQLKESTSIIKQKDLEIQKLKKEIEKLTKTQEICENCESLQQQIGKQNEFITKLYTFIESKGIPRDQINLEEKDKENDDLNLEEYDLKSLPKTIDIKTLMRRIEEMNAIIYEEGGASANFASEDGKVFKLVARKELQITFFKNGLVIEGYQFLPYSSVSAQKILQDIIDGYSPYILKERYPNGVIMKPVNNVHVNHTKDNGVGVVGCRDTGEKKMMSGEEFVKMFPEKVIKNGNVHNIREDMQKLLKLAMPDQNKPSDLDINKDQFELSKGDNIQKENLAKIKIQVTMVNASVNVVILKNEQIKKVFDFVQKYANECLSKHSLTLKIKTMNDYCFVMTYPFKIIPYGTNDTIEELGLFPSMFITFDTIAKYENKNTK